MLCYLYPRFLEDLVPIGDGGGSSSSESSGGPLATGRGANERVTADKSPSSTSSHAFSQNSSAAFEDLRDAVT